MPSYRAFDPDDFDDEATADELAFSNKVQRRSQRELKDPNPAPARPKFRPARSEAEQAFKCGHCKQFIGAPIAGGRQRNHCPNCLYSRHVDGKMPGDRKADCGALMKPAGQLFRRNGEQVILHLCLGCGKYDPNRIAADDNIALLDDLPTVETIEELQAILNANE